MGDAVFQRARGARLRSLGTGCGQRRASARRRDGVRRGCPRHRFQRARGAGPRRCDGHHRSRARRAVRGARATARTAGGTQRRHVGARRAARGHARHPRPRALRQRGRTRRHLPSAGARRSGTALPERLAAHAVRALELLSHVRRLGDDLHCVRRPVEEIRDCDRPGGSRRGARPRDLAATSRGDRGRRCRRGTLDAVAARGRRRARAARRRPAGLRCLGAGPRPRRGSAHGDAGRRQRLHGARAAGAARTHAAAAGGAHRRAAVGCRRPRRAYPAPDCDARSSAAAWHAGNRARSVHRRATGDALPVRPGRRRAQGGAARRRAFARLAAARRAREPLLRQLQLRQAQHRARPRHPPPVPMRSGPCSPTPTCSSRT